MKGAGILAIAAVAGLGAGFLVGFVWGAGTKNALGSNTAADFSGGVLTVKVDAAGAAKAGLGALLG